ncbi:MAG: M23 family metallopeptidase [Xanthomonadales bacterium]|nr:M23 family metallopeptidase [Xanthomonadales bacterium]
MTVNHLPLNALSCFPVDRGNVTTPCAPPRSGRTAVVEFENGYLQPRGEYLHHAIDIWGTIGMPLLAPVDGRVVGAWNGQAMGDAGYWVRFVDLAGYSHYYSHMNAAPLLTVGATFRAGAQLGELGQTGNARRTVPHLHYQVRGLARRSRLDRLMGGGQAPPLAEQADGTLDPVSETLLTLAQPDGRNPFNPYRELARLALPLGATSNPGGRYFIPAASGGTSPAAP